MKMLDLRWFLVTLLSLGASMLIAGCPETTGCTTGMSIACACTDGRSGAQICQADGTYGMCVCGGMPDAGVDAPISTDVPGGSDVPMTRDVGPRDAGPPPCIRDIDLLFEIDTSNSMVEEQALLAAELPRLVRVLATGDRNGDGTRDFMPADSLHLGVITPDLGAGDVSIPSCDPGFGDDGILRSTSPGTMAGCMPSYPSGVFTFRAGIDDITAVATDFTCVASVGTGGCGFEQQLEAVLKALSPTTATSWVRADYAVPSFALGGMPHGNNLNDGFVRDGSLLAITVLTDEDDCSVPDYHLFDISDPRFVGTDLNLRCSAFEDTTLYPLSRYTDGLLQLRDDPRLLVYTAITGVPVTATGDSVAAYDAVLALPEMQNVPDPAFMPPSRLTPVCVTAGTTAYPARRLVGAARELLTAGARTHVGSICQSSFATDINVIIDAIAAGAPSCM